jgi:hypothetical protein
VKEREREEEQVIIFSLLAGCVKLQMQAVNDDSEDSECTHSSLFHPPSFYLLHLLPSSFFSSHTLSYHHHQHCPPPLPQHHFRILPSVSLSLSFDVHRRRVHHHRTHFGFSIVSCFSLVCRFYSTAAVFVPIRFRRSPSSPCLFSTRSSPVLHNFLCCNLIRLDPRPTTLESAA